MFSCFFSPQSKGQKPERYRFSCQNSGTGSLALFVAYRRQVVDLQRSCSHLWYFHWLAQCWWNILGIFGFGYFCARIPHLQFFSSFADASSLLEKGLSSHDQILNPGSPWFAQKSIWMVQMTIETRTSDAKNGLPVMWTLRNHRFWFIFPFSFRVFLF